MKYTVLAYFDKDTEKYNPPILAPMPLDDAIEGVIDGCKKGQIQHAKSFVCCHLGYYDTKTGKFELNQEPKKVVECDQYVKD